MSGEFSYREMSEGNVGGNAREEIPRGNVLEYPRFYHRDSPVTNCTSNLLFYLFTDATTVFFSGGRDQDLVSYKSHKSNLFRVNLLSLKLAKSSCIIFAGYSIEI